VLSGWGKTQELKALQANLAKNKELVYGTQRIENCPGGGGGGHGRGGANKKPQNLTGILVRERKYVLVRYSNAEPLKEETQEDYDCRWKEKLHV